MNKDDIIRMAQDAGMTPISHVSTADLICTRESIELFANLVAAAERERLLPDEPSPGLLMSMAIRYDHGLGMPGFYDHPFQKRFDDDGHQKRLESTLMIMRQLYDEVALNGFYCRDKEDEYAAIGAMGKA